MSAPVCAWCPGFDPTTSAGVSHGMCPACAERFAVDDPRTVHDVERTIEEAQRVRRRPPPTRASHLSKPEIAP